MSLWERDIQHSAKAEPPVTTWQYSYLLFQKDVFIDTLGFLVQVLGHPQLLSSQFDISSITFITIVFLCINKRVAFIFSNYDDLLLFITSSPFCLNMYTDPKHACLFLFPRGDWKPSETLKKHLWSLMSLFYLTDTDFVSENWCLFLLLPVSPSQEVKLKFLLGK